MLERSAPSLIALSLLGLAAACGSEGPTSPEDQLTAPSTSAAGATTSLRADGGPSGSNGPCVPKKCPPGATCGLIDDGCGKKVACGATAPGTTERSGACLGGAVCDPTTLRCGPAALSCAAAGAKCGVLLDPCGVPFSCGTCAAGQHCDAQNQCVPGAPPSPTCGALSCTDPTSTSGSGRFCGTITDACGKSISCGACPAGETCGGGGVPFKCGSAPECAGRQCGTVTNACGSATFQCGACAEGSTCGADGQCHERTKRDAGTPAPCTPTTTNACAGRQCGYASDGCKAVSCGGCGSGEICNGSGQCESCTPNANACAGRVCGTVNDGCGRYVSCGGCTGPNDSCNAAGQCQTCTPSADPCGGQTCGTAYDGCSKFVTCGTCGAGAKCTGGSCCVPQNPCTGVAGTFSDGCGGTVNCVGGGGGGGGGGGTPK